MIKNIVELIGKNKIARNIIQAPFHLIFAFFAMLWSKEALKCVNENMNNPVLINGNIVLGFFYWVIIGVWAMIIFGV